MKKSLLLLASILLLSPAARAQEFEIKKYDLNAKLGLEAQAVEVAAKLRLVNLSAKDLVDKLLLAGDDKPRLSFTLNARAKVAAMAINGAPVTFRSSEAPRTNTLIISTDITTAIASAREFDLELAYSIQSPERSESLHLSTGESFLLPASFWFPVNHTPFGEHGADTAPYTLTVTAPTGQKVVSSGIRKSETSFEQSLAALPWVIAGDYDVIAQGSQAQPVEVYVPRGLNEAGKQQAQRVAGEAERMVAYFAKYFNVPPSAPFRVVSTQARGLAFAAAGAVALDDSLFRRDVLDQATIELMAAAAAKAWVDGGVLLRGRGAGLWRDGLPIYLAGRYLGERFGEGQRAAAFERYRRAYAPLARGSDAPLLMQSPIDRNYTTSVYNKGALAWRMVERRLGQQAFDNFVRQALDRGRVDVLSLNPWKAPLCGVSRCTSVRELLLSAPGADRASVEGFFAQWVDAVVQPDFAVGQPQAAGGGVESTIANFGSGDFTVEVVATTDKGERLNQSVLVKGGEFGTVTFPAGTRIATIEADPEKLYIQKDYANDAYPRRPAASDLYGQAALALSKNEFPAAEAKAREALTSEPGSPTLQTLLGRAVLGGGKRDEAAQLFRAALKTEPLPLQAYAWAHLGLGEISLQQGAFAEAANHFRLAAATEIDPTVARDGALKAERGANQASVGEEVKTFLQKLDAAILQGSAAVRPLIELGNLKRFSQSFVAVKPTSWTTEALRTEQWDADRVAVDVTIKTKIEARDYAGRALYVLSRAGGQLRLSEVPVFDVK